MDQLRGWIKDVTKSEMLVAILVITIICLGWRLLTKSVEIPQPCVGCDQDQVNTLANLNTRPPSKKLNLVLYYATWCGYSREFLPIWDSFETYAKQHFSNITTNKVKCEGGNEKMCSKKGVEGYPTVIMYSPEGDSVKFNGDRTLEELIQFCQRYSN